MQKQSIGGNARAVVAALIAATGASLAGQRLCAILLDGAMDAMMTAPAAMLLSTGGGADTVDRLAGVALLAQVCASCRLCSRGEDLADAARTTPRVLGPIGRQRRAGL